MDLSRQQVRDIDRRALEEFGLPGAVLMENAGRGAAELLLALGIRGPVLVCCGKGNNGGDGFVIARHLDNHGVSVRVLLFGTPDTLRGDAALYFNVLAHAGIPVAAWNAEQTDADALRIELASVDWVVDALFGTGLTGPVRPPFDTVIRTLNAAPAKVLAVDLPSGLDCDTGEPLGETVRANATATFVARKTGFANPRAGAFLGAVHVLDIGVPRKLTDPIV